MPSERASPRDMIEDAKLMGMVLRCHPDGDSFVDFRHVEFVGSPGGEWVVVKENWDESRTCKPARVTTVTSFSEPDYELVVESESRFAELRGSDHGE